MTEDMRKVLTERRDELRTELVRGEERLAQLDKEAAELRSTMLRISGAIQVLEEMLAGDTVSPGGGAS